jgi:hypothetical protein
VTGAALCRQELSTVGGGDIKGGLLRNECGQMYKVSKAGGDW